MAADLLHSLPRPPLRAVARPSPSHTSISSRVSSREGLGSWRGRFLSPNAPNAVKLGVNLTACPGAASAPHHHRHSSDPLTRSPRVSRSVHVSSSSRLPVFRAASAAGSSAGGERNTRGGGQAAMEEDGKFNHSLPDDVIASELAYILPPTPTDQPASDTASASASPSTFSSASAPPYLLLVAPGAFIPPLSYLPLVRAIRSAAPPSLRARLWAAVLQGPNFADPEGAKTWARDGYNAVVQAVKEMGADVTNTGGTPRVFVLGHSMGAFLVTSVARESCLGFINLGATHNSQETSLLHFPRPTLTILGERDGQAPPISMALAVQELDPGTPCVSLGAASGESSVVAPGSATAAALGPMLSVVQKPFVIIKGMNHAQGGNGVVSKERGDLEASRPVVEVREEIGRLVSAFMLLNLHSDNGWAPLLLGGGRVGGREGDGEYARGGGEGEEEMSVECEKAVKLLEGAVGWSLAYLRPFWKSMAMESGEPQHVLNAVLSHADLPTVLSSHTIFHRFQPDFIRSKPALLSSPHDSSLEAPQKHPAAALVLQSAWLQPQGKFWPCQSHTLWVKCKTAAALREVLGLEPEAGTAATAETAADAAAEAAPADRPSFAVAFSTWLEAAPVGVRRVAASLNEVAMQQALEMVHPHAREKYEREGKKMVFGEDKILGSSNEWIKADVEWLAEQEGVGEGDGNGRGEVMVVRSPVLISPNEILPGEWKERFGGMHYVKVITVARAMQWIMIESFR